MKKLFLCLALLLTVTACSGSSVIVEEFVGKNVQDVYAWCGQLDDESSCEVTYEEVEGYDKDIVFEQSIKAGKKLKGNIVFKVSSGTKSEVIVPFISPEATLSDMEMWKEAVGLQTMTYVYEVSDTVEKNHIIRMEPNIHIYKDTPVVLYVSSGPAPAEDKDIEIKFGEYLNLTVAEFEAKAKELGLKPNHQESRDIYNANVKIGNIVWHGSGIYEKDEVFNYGVCINAITVTPNQYVGKTEEEFKKIATDLNLTPKYVDSRDAYSTSIAKGSVVTHGYGVYVEEEEFKYGLSKGPAKVESGYEGALEENFKNYLAMLELNGDRQTSSSNTVSSGRIISYNYGKYSSGDTVTYYVSTGPEQTSVNVPNFEAQDESALLNFLSANGLYVGTRSEVSSVYSKGKIVSNDYGTKNKGDVINYVVSSGDYDSAIIESFDTIYQHVTAEGDYDKAAFTMHRYLFGRGFINYEIIPVAYKDYNSGILLRIEVNGVEHTYAEDVALDAKITVMISKHD